MEGIQNQNIEIFIWLGLGLEGKYFSREEMY